MSPTQEEKSRNELLQGFAIVGGSKATDRAERIKKVTFLRQPPTQKLSRVLPRIFCSSAFSPPPQKPRRKSFFRSVFFPHRLNIWQRRFGDSGSDATRKTFSRKPFKGVEPYTPLTRNEKRKGKGGQKTETRVPPKLSVAV